MRCLGCHRPIEGDHLAAQYAAGQWWDLRACSVRCADRIGSLGGWIVGWRYARQRLEPAA